MTKTKTDAETPTPRQHKPPPLLPGLGSIDQVAHLATAETQRLCKRLCVRMTDEAGEAINAAIQAALRSN